VSDELIPLSDREMEIVQLLATGATNQQIAQELVISVNTVKVHLRNIYAKLSVASRTEATMVAVRQGWVGIPATVVEEEAAEEAGSTAPLSALPSLDSTVSLGKRIALAAAIVLAALTVVLPLALQGQSNGGGTDVIGSVLPTAPSGSPADRWHTRAQMPTPRNGLAVVAYDDLIYAIGGVTNEGFSGKVEVYDPRADAWSTLRSKPTPVGFASAAAIGGKIYVPGGIGAGVEFLNVLEVYDPAKDSWTSTAPMPVSMGAYGLAALNDELYLFGGKNDQGYLASVFRYDPQGDRWQELEPMDRPRGFLSAANLGERIYVLGGYDDVTEFDRCDAFEPASGSWTPCAPLEMGRGGLAAVAVRDYVYALGGGMTTYLAFNERYDPRTDAWTRIDTPVTGLWRGLGVAFANTRIYAIGGWHEGNLSTNEAYQALFQIQVPLGP
jgi:DNA-binding CsgD family transcriptional regulator